MNPQVKADWVKRLRSGLYSQSKDGYLHFDTASEEEKYCCLGVLAEMARESGLVYCYAIRGINAKGRMIALYDGCTTYPPQHVGEWAELDPQDQLALVKMNDGEFNFNEIADYIENNL